jgi:transaldolase
MDVATDTPLARMARTTPTEYWNDSCAVSELEYAIANGAVGATSNPTIVLEVLRKEWATWQPRLREMRAERPEATDVDITWQLIEEMAVAAARLLEPTFVREGGRKGRLSMQTNPTWFASPERMLAQGVRFDQLAPNMQVKFPATRAGLAAIEEATERGISINATVSFTLPQALAVGEAVERGLRRREAEGHDVSAMSPVCTLMMGRLDDGMKAVCERDDILLDPGALNWAGIAIVKKAHSIFRSRGYRTRLLAAAYRHQLHWTELIGGDLSLTMTSQWQKRFNASSIDVRPHFDDPVDPRIVDQLSRIPDFRRAYDEDGLSVEEFDTYSATVRTLRAFIASYYELLRTVDDILLPNPDLRQSS